MGTRGPAPKRDNQRRRRNKPTTPIKGAAGASDVKRPPVNPRWNKVAKLWYLSLEESGQVAFYEPSDWALAYLIAESISRELAPRAIYNTEGKKVATVSLPPKGAALAAWLKAMSDLLVSEGARRRAAIELARPQRDSDEEADAHVSHLDDARARLRGPS